MLNIQCFWGFFVFAGKTACYFAKVKKEAVWNEPLPVK